MILGSGGHKVVDIASLPSEVTVKILLELDWRTVLLVQEVNRSFRDLVRSHKVLQYHVELGITGMVDGPSASIAPFTIDERLAKLRLYQSRWEHLAFSRTESIRSPNNKVWELNWGILAQADVITGAGDNPENIRKMLFTKLPTEARGNQPLKDWVHECYDFGILDFTMNALEDLLVLLRVESSDGSRTAYSTNNESVSIEVHLRSLTTSAMHPKAKLSVLKHKLNPEFSDRYVHFLQVCRNLLCVFHSSMFNVGQNQIVLWDWNTGEMMFKIQRCYILASCFLTDQHLLFATSAESTVPSGQGDSQMKFVICDIEKTVSLTSTNQDSYIAICELHLPEIDPMAVFGQVLIRSEPSPLSFSSYRNYDGSFFYHHQRTTGTLGQESVPFSISPNNRLFVITIEVLPSHGSQIPSEVEDSENTQVDVVIFIPFSTFLQHILSSQETEVLQTKGHNDVMNIDRSHVVLPRSKVSVGWESWLRDGACLLVLPTEEHVWICNVFGSRFVYPLEPFRPDEPRAGRHVVVFDFNAPAIRRSQAIRPKTGEDDNGRNPAIVDNITEPTTVPSTFGIFVHDVTTTLPYRRSIIRKKYVFEGLLLSEDNLILVDRKANKQYKILTI